MKQICGLREDMNAERKNYKACYEYAKAWNILAPSGLIVILEEDVKMTSQYILEDLDGKRKVSEYIESKMQTIKNAGEKSKVFAQLGETQTGFAGKNCVLIGQGDNTRIDIVVLLKIKEETGKISQIDICMPELLNPKPSGIFPA